MDETTQRIAKLEKQVAELADNKIAVNMTINADTNLFRSVLRTLRGRINLGIGTSSPSTSAMLDIVSTNLGFRMPCMTTAQRDAITVVASSSLYEGLLIYNTTTHVLNFYNGTTWGAV